MNLWIRSQDKTSLLKMKDIEIQERGTRPEDAPMVNCDYEVYINCTCAGYYETKQRCIEILDEIQDMILTEQIGIDSAGNECVIPMQFYQMPQE